MEDRRSVIISAIIGILVLALIIGVIIYLIRFITNRPPTNPTPTPRPSVTVRPSNQPTPTASQNPNPDPTVPGATTPPTTDTKKYPGSGFEINYPANWGILTCNNSANFEFDPTNPADFKGVACEYALKPITILVGSNSCQDGESVTKGGVSFTKIKKTTSTGVNYKWCTQTTPALEITHRVSSQDGRAKSTQDFSAQVEELISRIRFGNSI